MKETLARKNSAENNFAAKLRSSTARFFGESTTETEMPNGCDDEEKSPENSEDEGVQRGDDRHGPEPHAGGRQVGARQDEGVKGSSPTRYRRRHTPKESVKGNARAGAGTARQ
tara:strand:- start:6247 stop:6585 length:339 start_codon:yes stop_codon:yes gene_type:complete